MAKGKSKKCKHGRDITKQICEICELGGQLG